MQEIKELTLAQIVNSNHKTANVFENYHLDFCCKGKRTLEQACFEQGLPLAEIISALENTLSKNESTLDFEQMTLTQLCEYIVHTHHAYVRNELPLIFYCLEKVSFKHGERHPELNKIVEIFATVKDEMERHMQKEELILFPRIKELQKLTNHETANLQVTVSYLQSPISVMEHEHDSVGSLLNEIRILTNNYTPPADACTTYRLSFAALKDFELDLHQHVHLENNILFPKSVLQFKQLNESVLN